MLKIWEGGKGRVKYFLAGHFRIHIASNIILNFRKHNLVIHYNNYVYIFICDMMSFNLPTVYLVAC